MMWSIPILFMFINVLCFISEYLRINKTVRVEYRDTELFKLFVAFLLITLIIALATFLVVFSG